MNHTELERQYSPSSCVDNFDELIVEYTSKSKEVEEITDVRKNLQYGADHELLDLFPVDDKGAPLLIFIHGGYWQALSKNDSNFPGYDLQKRGVAYATLDYTIAPEGNITSMIDQCVKAVLWLYAHASDLGFSKDRIFLSGSSAGAHLATMTILKINKNQPNLISGALLLSGVYDLEPLIDTYINDPLYLTTESSYILSPLNGDLSLMPKSLISWGENETSEFKRQSKEMANKLKDLGLGNLDFEMKGRNHFDIVHDLPSLWDQFQSHFSD